MIFNINKLKGVLATVLTVACSFAYAQNYNITPGNSIVGVAPFNLPTHFNIQQNNLTNGSLVFSWEQISINIPQDWTANLCDNGHCYTGFPLAGTMDTVFTGDYGLMSVGINPDSILGTAIIQYAVWEANSPTQKDTLTWIISSNSVTGINSNAIENIFTIYPNPTFENINIISNQQSELKFIITNFSGKIIQQGIYKLNDNCFSIKNIPNGIYFISLFENNKILNTQKIIIYH